MALMRTVVHALVNRRARQRYATFWNCLLQVGEQVNDARKLVARMDDSAPVAWHRSSPEEVLREIRRVEKCLAILGKSGRKWEAQLISRDWNK